MRRTTSGAEEDPHGAMDSDTGVPSDPCPASAPVASSPVSSRPSSLHGGIRQISLSRRISIASIPSSTRDSKDAEAGQDEGDGGDGAEEAGSIGLLSMSREKKLTFVTFCMANFCVGAYYSILAPFFPNEAQKKGVSNTLVGLIFGCFELSLVLMSPVFGNFITDIGAKFLYCSGMFFCGANALLFGFLDESPDGTPYIVMCFLVRLFEGLGAAAFSTASFAIMANMFPKNVATMFGTLELFSGLGMMVGPPLGGALYQLGGFKLPFISTGCLLMVLTGVSVYLLPPQHDMEPKKGFFVLGLLRIPVVSIVCYLLMAGAIGIGFLDVGLSVFLTKHFALSPVILGLVFLVGPGVYTLTAPIWGAIADKKPEWSEKFLIGGFTIGGFAYYMMGPAPFIPIASDQLWLVLVSMAFFGLGVGTLVMSFQVITNAARKHGYPDSLETFGLISGLFNCFFSLGALLGPVAGGALIDALEFEMAAAIVGSFGILGALILLVYVLVRKASPTVVKVATTNHAYVDPSEVAHTQSSISDEAEPTERTRLMNSSNVRTYMAEA